MTDVPPPADTSMTYGSAAPYPARLEIAYPDRLNRLTTAFRLVLVIPILIVVGVLTGSGSGISITGGLFVVTLLLILFRQRYPRWWFDFALELYRFTTRIAAYLALLTDRYPSTVEQQAVALDLDYPNVEQDLSRGLPLVKCFLAIPHYIVLFFLVIGAVVAIVLAWFAILFTGQYPRGLFDYVVGVTRWGLRVEAYAFLLITDRYPPFSLH